MESQYSNYMTAVDKAISRQGSKELHKEIKYLESMLLYLTQECKTQFKSLIKCDYLTESVHIQLMADLQDKYIEEQKKAKDFRVSQEKPARDKKPSKENKGFKDYLPDIRSKNKQGMPINHNKEQKEAQIKEQEKEEE